MQETCHGAGQDLEPSDDPYAKTLKGQAEKIPVETAG
jgi:hypothetical protein